MLGTDTVVGAIRSQFSAVLCLVVVIVHSGYSEVRLRSPLSCHPSHPPFPLPAYLSTYLPIHLALHFTPAPARWPALSCQHR
eukprot:3247410-Rhodomonas_salina.1